MSWLVAYCTVVEFVGEFRNSMAGGGCERGKVDGPIGSVSRPSFLVESYWLLIGIYVRRLGCSLVRWTTPCVGSLETSRPRACGGEMEHDMATAIANHKHAKKYSDSCTEGSRDGSNH